MEDFLINILNDYGYFAIAFLIFFENIFPPIPSEVILLFGGFMTSSTDMNLFMAFIAATIGTYAGACALYFIGTLLDEDRLNKIISGKIGKILHLRAEHMEKAFAFFEKYRNKAVLICRCIPVVRSIISVPAGMSHMSFPLFTILTLIGSSVWNFLLLLLGNLGGSAWHKYVKYFDGYSKIALIVICIVVVIGAFIVIKRYKKNKKS
ncbi:MAG: DedA family protein [Ruminococcaceae bacterium]|nr:DedA family protein [Oscillospiraceae bacterium]